MRRQAPRRPPTRGTWRGSQAPARTPGPARPPDGRPAPDALENDIAEDVRRDDLVRPGDRYPRRACGNENQREQIILSAEHGIEVGVPGVGDKGFVPADHELAAHGGDGRADRLQVGADVGLGQREGGDGVKRPDGGQPPLAYRVAPALGHGEAADALHREQRVEVAAHAGQRLADHCHRQ